MISVTVNNISYSVEEGTNLQTLLNKLDISQNGIAVAKNQSIIQKAEWETTRLIPGDDILIITATQGG